MKLLLECALFVLFAYLYDTYAWYDPRAEEYRGEWWQVIFGAVFLVAMAIGVYGVYRESVYGKNA